MARSDKLSQRAVSQRAVARLQRMSLWQRGLAWLLVFGLIAGSAGAAFVLLGLSPVAASAGHWAITDWFLHFAMRRAVATRSLGISAPALDDPALMVKGAGHYATGCAPCHGTAEQGPPLVPHQMTPKPPWLPPKVGQWEPRELFWIVRHGVKFTAMPAWPALERKDEVWAMVAFLQRLPELNEDEYRQLAYGPVAERTDEPGDVDQADGQLRDLNDPMASILADCSRCHGEDGGGRGTGAFPVLAGQRSQYLFASLRAYAEGERHSGIMQAVVAEMDGATLGALAEHYAGLAADGADQLQGRAATPPAAEDAAAFERGRRLALEGAPEKGLPACVECHGPREGPRNPHYPTLAGQYADYLLLQLQLFKDGTRGGSPYAHIMESVVERLSPEQMQDLALFYSRLPASPAQ